MPADIRRRCQAVEQCYEFMLAYAAQGLASETGNQPGTQSARSCNVLWAPSRDLIDNLNASIHPGPCSPISSW
jgi:hypothetical protein